MKGPFTAIAAVYLFVAIIVFGDKDQRLDSIRFGVIACAALIARGQCKD